MYKITDYFLKYISYLNVIAYVLGYLCGQSYIKGIIYFFRLLIDECI